MQSGLFKMLNVQAIDHEHVTLTIGSEVLNVTVNRMKSPQMLSTQLIIVQSSL